MKNLFVIAIMTLLSTSIFANSETPVNDNSQVTVEAEATNTAVILRLTNLEEQPTSVYLKNDNDAVVFTREMKATSNIALRLDLSQVGEGEYTLHIKRSGKSFIQDITVNKDGSVAVGEMTTWVKPALRMKTDKFVVTNPNASVKSVKMYNKAGELVYSKRFGKKEKAAANVAFNLSQVEKGAYTVIVSTFNDAYQYEVEVK